VSLLYDQADAEDLIQDCLETALAKRATLKDPLRVRAWMFAILNNLFLMRMRSGSRRAIAGSIEEFADSLAAAAPPEDRATALDLARAMSKLPIEHRQILLLINLDGHSYQDVAEILSVPIGTVMSRLARARERLRALLDGRALRAVED
jgi:RNA polymerase sigma-70 factor (ECF subfamily)